MKKCTYEITKMFEKPELPLRTISIFTTRKDFIRHLDTKHLTRCIMLRESRSSKSNRVRSPHGGILLAFVTHRDEITNKPRNPTTPGNGVLPELSLNGKCWQRTNHEVNKFQWKNCLDIGVHHTSS